MGCWISGRVEGGWGGVRWGKVGLWWGEVGWCVVGWGGIGGDGSGVESTGVCMGLGGIGNRIDCQVALGHGG